MSLFKKLLPLIVVLAIISSFIIVAPVSAATSQDVTVTAQPKYISISLDNNTWTIGGLTGAGVIDPSTTYFSNPLGDTTSPSSTVVDGECRFSMTNTSSVHTNIKMHWHNFSGGDANMTNGSGTPGATAFAGFAYISGALYSAKVTVNATDVEVIHDLGETTNKKFGLTIQTQTDAWTGGASSTATMTVSAEAHT